MTRILLGSLVAVAMLSAGCQKKSEQVAEERADLQEERVEAEQKKAEIDAKANEKLARESDPEDRADIVADATEDKAKQDREVADEQEDVLEAERDLNKEAYNERDRNFDETGRGGSGTYVAPGAAGTTAGTTAAAQSVSGTVKSTMGDNLKLMDQSGAEFKLDTSKYTQVFSEGRAIKLDDLKEGTEVRASYHLEGTKNVADRVEVVRPGTLNK